MIGRNVKTHLTICLVDKDPVTRILLGDMLNEMGIRVSIFCSMLTEAIDEYENYAITGPPNIIMIEWTRQLKDPDFLAIYNNCPLAKVPIILLLDDIPHNSPTNQIKGITIINQLKKPITRKDLKDTLLNYLKAQNP